MALVAVLVTISRRGVPVDDAWIVLRYARNLLSGHGWVYNIGENVNGSTSTLNTLLLAIVGCLTGDLPTAQSIVFCASLWGVGWLTYLALRPWGFAPAGLAALVVICLPLPHSTFGLESTLMLAMVCAAAHAYVRGRLTLAGVALGLGFLARGDVALLALPLALAAAMGASSRRATIRTWVRMFSASAVVVMPWVVYSTWTFGSPLPGTLGAKLAQTAGGSWPDHATFWALSGPSFRYLDGHDLALGPWPFLAGAAAGLVCVWLHRSRSLFASLVISWGALQFTAYSLLRMPGYHWYFVPAHFAIALAFISLFIGIWGREPRFDAAPARHLTAVFACAVWLGATCLQLMLPSMPRYPHYYRTAEWIRTSTPEDASVALMDIGVIGYGIGNRRVIDMCSLVHREGVRPVAEGRTDWWLDAF